MIHAKTLSVWMIAAIAVAVGFWWGLPSQVPPLEIAGIYFQEPKPLQPVTLIQANQQSFTEKDFKGQWTFLYFGYTYCPDICPITLSLLKSFEAQLAKQGLNDKTLYRLISVDPERDTPERLAEYTAFFGPKFSGLTGTPEQLTKIAQQFGVIYIIHEHAPGDKNYLVDHSSTIVLINPQGQLAAVFTPPHNVEKLVADFAAIRKRQG